MRDIYLSSMTGIGRMRILSKIVLSYFSVRSVNQVIPITGPSDFSLSLQNSPHHFVIVLFSLFWSDQPFDGKFSSSTFAFGLLVPSADNPFYYSQGLRFLPTSTFT